jgi:Trypsin-co-occurring domain 2
MNVEDFVEHDEDFVEHDKIGLKEAVQAAYDELYEAMTDMRVNEDLMFVYRNIDLEFTVEVTGHVGGKAGIKIWVLQAGADASRENTRSHVVRLSMEPRSPHGAPVSVHGVVKPWGPLP